MIEQYVYDKITQDPTLQGLLGAGSDDFNVYPMVVPRGVVFDRAVTFTLLITTDVYPASKSVTVQFNIFAKTHTDTVTICEALSNLFNEDNNNSSNGVDVVFSIRKAEADIAFNYDDGLWQRQATYYFKMR